MRLIDRRSALCKMVSLWFVYNGKSVFKCVKLIFWSRKGSRPKLKADAIQVGVATHRLYTSDIGYFKGKPKFGGTTMAITALKYATNVLRL